VSKYTPREIQLLQIRKHIDDRREDAAASRRMAAEHIAEAEESEEVARRWEIVYTGLHLGVIPGLDGCALPDVCEVPA
jgi:hypothetical protein